MPDISARTHIVHVTCVHASDDIRIFRKESSSLAKNGFKVTLIAPGPVSGSESHNGVQVILVPRYKSRLARQIVGAFSVFVQCLKVRGDVYHFHDPEFMPYGLALKILGKKVIYDSHEDLFEDVQSKEYLPRRGRLLIAHVLRGVEKFCCLFFDGIVAATPSIAQRFPKGKTVTVQNMPLKEELFSVDSIPFADRPRQVVYAGILSQPRAAVEMVEAIGQVGSKHGGKLVLMGNFQSAQLEERCKSSAGWNYVDFRGYQSRKAVAEQMNQALAGLVVFHAGPNHTNSQPNKLFEYMSAGLPVICSNFPAWRKIVEGVGCGLCVDPTDVNAISEAISWVVDHPNEAACMGEKGRAKVLTEWNWEVEALKLHDLYSRISPEPARA